MNNHPLQLMGLGTCLEIEVTQGSWQCSGVIQALDKPVSLSKAQRGGMEKMGFPGKIFQRCHFGFDTQLSCAY